MMINYFFLSKLYMSNFIIGVAIGIDSIFAGIKEAILEGFFLNSFNSEFIYYPVNGSDSDMINACNLFTAASSGYTNKCFIASASTSEFNIARNNLSADILVISLGSTVSTLPVTNNCLSMLYSDTNAASAIVNLLLYSQTTISPDVYVVYFQDSLYASGYNTNIQNALNLVASTGPQFKNSYTYIRGNVISINNALNSVKSTFKQNDILVFIGYPSDYTIAKAKIATFPKPFFFIGSDTMDGTDSTYIPNVYQYIVVPSFMDYTNATKNLYQSLFTKYPSLINYTSYMVPFAFDCSRQLYFMKQRNLPFNLNDFTLTRTTGIYQKAALETNWINVDNNRPFYGLYWFNEMQDNEWSNHVSDFRKITLGSSQTQPKSCAVGFRGGLAPWVNPNYYLLNRYNWQDIFNEDNEWIFTKLTSQGITVNTDQPFQSNKRSNQNIGTYNLLYQERSVPIIFDDTTNIISIVNNDKNINYPMVVEKIKINSFQGNNIYDLIIGGGGIAGLNSAYQLLKSKPNLKILILEKNDILGGRIKREYIGSQPVDMGAVRIPQDFVLTPNLATELGLSLIPFTTDLRGSFTREQWFSFANLNQSQSRYFLPAGTPPSQTPITLLFETLLELIGTLNYNDLNPNQLVNGIKIVDWGFYDLLKTKLTSEQIEWISNSLNFSFYKNEMNAYEWCIHNYHASQFYMIGPTFGNTYKLIEKLDENTPDAIKLFQKTIKAANYDNSRKIWTINVLDTVNNRKEYYFAKRFLSCIPNNNLRSVDINVPNLTLWNDKILNCGKPFELSRVYVKYPTKWWSATSGSYFDETTNKMVWIMSPTSNILLASYSDDFQAKYWKGIPDSKLLDSIHLGVCRAFNVDPNNVAKPTEYKKKIWTNPEYPVYWYDIGINGLDIQNLARKPFPTLPLYLASETLSQRPGWMEGALYASNATVEKIIIDINTENIFVGL